MGKLEQQDPETVAIAALGFIAGDAELLQRFLSLTGISAEGVREAAREPAFLAGVLQFILAHEPTVHQFCQSSGIAPQSVQDAHLRLAGNDGVIGVPG
jgi:hypothetical protein